MRVWKAVALVNLALAVGVGWGYLLWGREVERLSRDLAAARATAGADGEREYRGQGVVRAVLPEIDVVVITHDEIAGYMPAMTMGFRTASAKIHRGIRTGDAVRFVLRGTPPNLVITAIENTAP
jgi:Cu/Ag efflux protein CusF